jgi:hypothetical protein
MTTTPETTAPETPAAPPEETGEGDRSGEPESGAQSREAANYRRRLREVEAERDGLQGRVDQLERAEVERIAGEAPYWMIQPGDLWTIGVELAELRGDDGTLDAALVKAKVRDVLAERPTWRRNIDMGTGYRGGEVSEPKAGLSQLLGRGKR